MTHRDWQRGYRQGITDATGRAPSDRLATLLRYGSALLSQFEEQEGYDPVLADRIERVLWGQADAASSFR